MDISKLNDTEKLSLCKRYFMIGLAMLPLIWLTNFIWFFKDAFIRPSSQTQSSIRFYVILSGIGCVVWAVVLVSWETIFQHYRALGIEWADSLSIIFPLGKV